MSDEKSMAPTPKEENAYDQAEQGWRELIAAVDRIQAAANRLKKTERSIDGYDIEKAIVKHKPELMKKHLEGLVAHRKENKL